VCITAALESFDIYKATGNGSEKEFQENASPKSLLKATQERCCVVVLKKEKEIRQNPIYVTI